MDRLLETTTKTIEKTKTKKASWFKLFRLIIIKISYSFITAFLFLFSIVISVLSISVLFFFKFINRRFYYWFTILYYDFL